MTSAILVTGATGNVGSEVVRGLQKKEIAFRIGTSSLKSSPLSPADRTEMVHFDFLKPETFAATFDGIERLFLIRPPALSNVERDLAPAIHAAVAAGVKQIVFLSLQGVENNKIVPHYKIEQAILATGVHYTFLRASFFMQNLSTTQAAEIRDRDEIALPVGHAKTSFIDVRDIAAVAVMALTEPSYIDQKITLTGSEALDYDQVADKLSAELGRTIRYRNPSILRFIGAQIASGQKLGYTLVVAALYTITRFGNAKEVTRDVETLLGRSPITFEQFARDYRTSWVR